jgi:glycosyltransferase involved in cell wall biosynthesis
VPDEELRELYAGCRALLMPGEEDFGMTVVEALASGKPVVALNRGGAPEILRGCATRCGVLYDGTEEANLAKALEEFDRIEAQIDAVALRTHASRFSVREFETKMSRVLEPVKDAD